MHAERLISPFKITLSNLYLIDNTVPRPISIITDYTFSKHGKYLPKSMMPIIFSDHLARVKDDLLVATDGSVMGEKEWEYRSITTLFLLFQVS